ncbi:MAG: hypothetical protein WA102_14005 [Candidatus Methanoperedens sp.]
MLIRKGENVVKQQSGISAGIASAESGKNFGSLKGDITLTNQRVVYESVSGFLSKKTTTVIDCPLEKVVNVAVEGLIGKKLVLQLPMELSSELKMQSVGAAMMGEIPCKVSFGVKDPIEWERAIRQTLAG